MPIKTVEAAIDVVQAAKIRIKNIFDTGQKVYLSFSSGKDSICLSHLVYSLILEGSINRGQLTVLFFDEEGLYPSMVKSAEEWRERFMKIGVPFLWFCLPLKQVCCIDSLSKDESWITWDPSEAGKWMRDIPEYAITYSPHLKYPGQMNYQTFGQILARDGVTLVGLRADESITRRKAIAALLTGKAKTCMGYPIYDWKDTDVWRYIRDNGLYFPEIYCRLYEAGVPRNRLRLSAFFGDNTTHGLRYIAETDNELWERILVRMPNANLALLYWDSEMFRRSTKKRQSLEGDTKVDYKEKCYDLLFKNTDKYTIGADTIKRLGAWRSLFLKTYDIATPRHHKMMYESILYGDPKSRQLRAITNMIYSENGKRQRNGKA